MFFEPSQSKRMEKCLGSLCLQLWDSMERWPFQQFLLTFLHDPEKQVRYVSEPGIEGTWIVQFSLTTYWAVITFCKKVQAEACGQSADETAEMAVFSPSF